MQSLYEIKQFYQKVTSSREAAMGTLVGSLAGLALVVYLQAHHYQQQAQGGVQAHSLLLKEAPALQAPPLPQVDKFHLFGRYQPNQSSTKASAISAHVVGIFAAEGQQGYDGVILRVAHAPEKLYHVGDRLPNGAVIHAIYEDRVILNYNQQLQFLPLPKLK